MDMGVSPPLKLDLLTYSRPSGTRFKLGSDKESNS
jgi:hypothetical protein